MEYRGVPWEYLPWQVDADLEIDGSEGSKFRQIKALARSFQQLSSATATTYPLLPSSPLESIRVPYSAIES